MPSLFGIDIAAEVNAAIAGAGGVLDATLIKIAPGTRTALDLASGTNPTETSYACKGFMDAQTRLSSGTYGEMSAGHLVSEEEMSVTLLGASIAGGAVPVAGDRVTIEGATYQIGTVARDPAGATYACTVRGA